MIVSCLGQAEIKIQDDTLILVDDLKTSLQIKEENTAKSNNPLLNHLEITPNTTSESFYSDYLYAEISDKTMIPSIFSYSPDQARLRFKYINRTFSCHTVEDVFKIQDNKLTIDCKNDEVIPQFALGITRAEETFGNVRLMPK